MVADKLLAAVVAGVVAVVVMLGGGFTAMTASLAIQVEEETPPIPPEVEAAYRQVSLRTGVNWAVLAAWDAAENDFVLPIPSLAQVLDRLFEEALDDRRRAAPPPPEPELTLSEIQGIRRRAYSVWRMGLVGHIERRAEALAPFQVDFEQNPELVYRQFMGADAAARAAELFEGYLVLEGLSADADAILVTPVEPPVGWTPVEGFAWPVVAPITSRYGMRVSPIDGVRRLHAGIDLGVTTGTPVLASKDGTVLQAERDATYGLVVVIDHGDGYRSLYAHNSRLAVSTGQRVQQGQVIAYAGSTGWSTGPHLHFEIHYSGAPVDPLLLLTVRAERE